MGPLGKTEGRRFRKQMVSVCTGVFSSGSVCAIRTGTTLCPREGRTLSTLSLSNGQSDGHSPLGATSLAGDTPGGFGLSAVVVSCGLWGL